MTRPAFNAPLTVRPQYLSLLYHKLPNETTWTLLDQARAITPNSTSDERNYARIGDASTLTVGGQVTTSVTLQVYMDNNLEEVARVLGIKRPSGGWIGTETIRLDPTRVSDLKIESYDGVDVGADLLYTEMIYGFRPTGFSVPEEAEGDVRIAEINGSCSAYYIIPKAGL